MDVDPRARPLKSSWLRHGGGLSGSHLSHRRGSYHEWRAQFADVWRSPDGSTWERVETTP